MRSNAEWYGTAEVACTLASERDADRAPTGLGLQDREFRWFHLGRTRLASRRAGSGGRGFALVVGVPSFVVIASLGGICRMEHMLRFVVHGLSRIRDSVLGVLNVVM